ncbi:ATP-binding protein [Rheinheimera baltica]|uniref:histidine kinase n=1 Tax=Rheinheimera baltica TaxID=67576 RepID=A0ABT9I1T0_9GAMM|nr:hybrid sensor histidine kinase/response regulator transcription factor [Rheinheimera baltica]MDP5137339.1 ATP-binding protein [Rheinheimera baltica]
MLAILPVALNAAFSEVQLRLPQYSVIDALEDKSGYLWLATGTGLVRYDGYSLITYLKQVDDNHSLPANLVTALFEDNLSQLWLGTANGIARFVPQSNNFIRYLHKPDATERDDNSYLAFWQTESGLLLAGGRNGLFYFHAANNRFEELLLNGKSVLGVWKIAQQQGAVWIASDSGLMQLDEQLSLSLIEAEPVRDWIKLEEQLWVASGSAQKPVIRLLGTNTVVEQPGLRRFYRDASDRVWAFGEAGLVQLQTDGTVKWSFQQAEVFALMQTRSGDLLLGGNRGIYRYHGAEQGWQAMVQSATNKQNPVDRLFETADGTVFAVQGQSGLLRWVPTATKFAHYQPPLLQQFDSRGNNVVRHIYETEENQATVLWLSTRAVAKKLTLNADNTAIVSTDMFQLPVADSSYVDFHAIQPLQSNKLLVATAKGLYWLDPHSGDYTFATLNEQLPPSRQPYGLAANAEVFNFYLDDKCLWLLSDAGLGCAERDGSGIKYWFDTTTYPAFADNRLYSTYTAWDGALWLSGTKGVSRFNPADNSIVHFQHQPGNANALAHNWVHGVWQTGIDTYWVATREGGVNKLIWQPGQPAVWQRFGRQQGLPSDVIYGILGDNAGWLWLSTSQGLVRIHSETLEVRAYQPEDGVQSDEFNFSVMHLGQSGRFYFGGINGVNGFLPEQVQDNRVAPIVRLAAWAIHDRAVPLANANENTFALAHHDNHLSFDYVGLHYADPARITYQYKLAGVDKLWVQAGTDRHARYGALKPGHYQFWVKAANPDGVWSEPALLKTFIIRPHPLLTPWAFGCYALFVLALLLWYKRFRDSTEHSLRLRVQQGVAREAALSHHLRVQFEHTVHEMRTPLMRLASHSEHSLALLPDLTTTLEKPTLDKLGRSLQIISTAQAELQQLVDNQQKLEELKLQYGQQPVAIAAVAVLQAECSRLQHYAAEQNINLSWHSDELQLWLIPGFLELIVSQLLGNALKYCPAGSSVSLSLKQTQQHALLQVEDNGPGIAPADLAHIFIRHYRSASSENIAGNGEGLFLVKTCVEIAGGRITVENLPAGGCRFCVFLPLATTETTSEAVKQSYTGSAKSPSTFTQADGFTAPQLPSDVTGQHKVLIVEDNDGLREDLMQLLSPQYHCTCASSLTDAMTLAITLLPDVILSDVMMQQKDSGLQLLASLKSTLQTSHIPVVLLTALGDQHSLARGYQYQASAYLTKPASNAAILACIATQLAQNARLTQAVRHALQQNPQEATATNTTAADAAVNAAPKPEQENDNARLFSAKLQGVLSSCFMQPELKVADIARAFYKSESELQRKCRSFTGMSVSAVLQQYRYQQVCKLLLQSSPRLSIEQIAEQCGFGSARSLQRVFKQLYGNSPQHYRQQHSD